MNKHWTQTILVSFVLSKRVDVVLCEWENLKIFVYCLISNCVDISIWNKKLSFYHQNIRLITHLVSVVATAECWLIRRNQIIRIVYEQTDFNQILKVNRFDGWKWLNWISINSIKWIYCNCCHSFETIENIFDAKILAVFWSIHYMLIFSVKLNRMYLCSVYRWIYENIFFLKIGNSRK